MGNAAAEGQDKSVLVLAEQLFPVLEEADEHDHGRPRQPDKKHDFQQPHCKYGQLHMHDYSVFWTCPAAVCVLRREERRRNFGEKRRELAVGGDGPAWRFFPVE
jgi:hypothetical protein